MKNPPHAAMKLKEFYARYGPSVLGLSERDAYELQRVLYGVRDFEPGRPGPGGGAAATPSTVSLFCIAVMAGGPRQRAKEAAYDYYEMLQEGAEMAGWDRKFVPLIPECPLTGEHQFGPAFKRLLSDPKLASKVDEIRITRDWPEAVIVCRDGDPVSQSRFVDKYAKDGVARHRRGDALQTFCVLRGAIVRELADLLTNPNVPSNPDST